MNQPLPIRLSVISTVAMSSGDPGRFLRFSCLPCAFVVAIAFIYNSLESVTSLVSILSLGFHLFHILECVRRLVLAVTVLGIY